MDATEEINSYILMYNKNAAENSQLLDPVDMFFSMGHDPHPGNKKKLILKYKANTLEILHDTWRPNT